MTVRGRTEEYEIQAAKITSDADSPSLILIKTAAFLKMYIFFLESSEKYVIKGIATVKSTSLWVNIKPETNAAALQRQM